MATQLKEDFTEATRWRRRPRPTFAWAAQAVSGVLLLVLVAVHMVAQHFVVSGGLRTYADVVAWIRNSAWPWPPSCTACGCWT
jgi:succinate dehydrogenase hydrophobic anchor subunit